MFEKHVNANDRTPERPNVRGFNQAKTWMLEPPNIGSLTHLNLQVGKEEVYIYTILYLHFEHTHFKEHHKEGPMN